MGKQVSMFQTVVPSSSENVSNSQTTLSATQRHILPKDLKLQFKHFVYQKGHDLYQKLNQYFLGDQIVG
jgi:hypothetical protein